MARGGYDVRTLAKTINRRRQEYNRLHPDRPVPITSAMSRILENDETYVPYRPRAAAKRYQPSTNPSLATLVEIADALGTTVGDLLGEPAYRITTADRRRRRELVRYLIDLFDLDARDLDDDADPRLPRRHGI